MSSSSIANAPTDQDGFGPIEDMGPIDFLAFEFPHKSAPGAGLQMLLDLVDRGIIRVLDLAIIRKETDGSVRRVTIAELGPEFAAFDGAASGLLDDSDVAQAAEMIAVDSAAALLVYENRWAAPLATTLRREGAQLIAADRLPVQAIIAALDAAEATT